MYTIDFHVVSLPRDPFCPIILGRPLFEITTANIDDASLSSNDSYYVETDNNLSAEALCLDTHLKTINNDELEIESCGTNMQGEECHDNSSMDELVSKSEIASKGEELEEENTLLRITKEEYYQVFP